MEKLSGSVERITYYNPENGYSVLRLLPVEPKKLRPDRTGLITVVGHFPELAVGESVNLQGNWITHPKHGNQFQATKCETRMPATVAGIRRYLGSGIIKGIGPQLADRIVSHFGEDTLDVLDQKPELLLNVTDIGPKRAQLIVKAWEEQKQIKEIMLFLHSHNISSNLATKIFKHYGQQSLDIVTNNPYQLSNDIDGVGFKTADKIAHDIGLRFDHPSRVEAGILYTLKEKSDSGNIYLPQQDLIDQTSELLGILPEKITPIINHLSNRQLIRKEIIRTAGELTGNVVDELPEGSLDYGLEQTGVYLGPLYSAEVGVAKLLSTLASTFPTRLSDLPPAFISMDPNLSDEQKSAIKISLNHPVSILTGGPGTGKTTAIRSLIAILESGNKTYALASPTGRAAKRLSEATDRPASTIHRLLGYSIVDGFTYNAENPLKVDYLVIDESSMLDITVAYNLLKAVQPGSHLLFVGDVDQLPSVGPGDLLRDLIKSKVFPVTRLHTIFRQAANSLIITNSHRINRGEVPIFPPVENNVEKPAGDFFLFPTQTPDNTSDWLVDIVCNRIPTKFGFSPMLDVQVLAPMYRGPVGVNNLNDRLQENLNPYRSTKSEISLLGKVFRKGDKLMQTKNNYDKDIYNGDIGYLTGIDHIDQQLEIEFDGRRIYFDWNEVDELTHAYAISVHKSQGSEFNAIVIPLVTQHYVMLQRNLLYTAVTRAKKLCVIVGSRRAMTIAVKNNTTAHRLSALNWRLTQY